MFQTEFVWNSVITNDMQKKTWHFSGVYIQHPSPLKIKPLFMNAEQKKLELNSSYS